MEGGFVGISQEISFLGGGGGGEVHDCMCFEH